MSGYTDKEARAMVESMRTPWDASPDAADYDHDWAIAETTLGAVWKAGYAAGSRSERQGWWQRLLGGKS